jgi:hypothetical protein
MAKKKTVKKQEKPKVNYSKQIEDLTDLVLKAACSITETNKRIDRIVAALGKSKSVKGL